MRGTDFYGSEYHAIQGPRKSETADEVLDSLVSRLGHGIRDPRVHRSAAERRCLGWECQINGLDPFVHRAVYQLIKALRLRDAGFDEESVVALDAVSSVVAQYAQHRMGSGGLSRSGLGSLLRLPSQYTKRLMLIYELRSEYGAHPAWSKWWDFGEMYDDMIGEFFDVQRLLFSRLVRHECRHRVVDPEPVSWSAWFEEHADMIFEAVG